MHLYNIKTTNTLNTTEDVKGYIINKQASLLDTVNDISLKTKQVITKIRNAICMFIMYSVLAIVVGGATMLQGISVINGKVCFNPELVILPTLELLLYTLGFYLVVELFKDVKDSFKERSTH